MKKFLFGGLALLLAGCAPAFSGPPFDAAKVQQEIQAYQPHVEFAGAEGLYVVVKDTASGMVQQRLDNLTDGKVYTAVFSAPGATEASVDFTANSVKQSVVVAPKLTKLSVGGMITSGQGSTASQSQAAGGTTAMQSQGESGNSLSQAAVPQLDLSTYNVNNYTLIITKDGQSLTSISKLGAGTYGWLLVRSGYSSTPSTFTLTPGQPVVLKMPALPAFLTDAVAQARVAYNSANSASRGGSSGGLVPVRGYFRSDGTYVAPHYRSAPRRR